MNRDWRPAEVFPVRTYLEEELAERGMTLERFARRIGWSLEELGPMLDGDAWLTGQAAQAIGNHLGISPMFWGNLALYYRRYRRNA